MYNRLSSLDTLRAFAILGVIAAHTSQQFSINYEQLDSIIGLGRYGVQLFFVISGFTMMLVSMKSSADVNFKRNFYIKRFLRIVPLYYLAAVFYIPLNGSYFSTHEIEISSYILNFLLLSGFSPQAINSVVPGGWSIVNELYFYLLFPLLFPVFKDIKTLPILVILFGSSLVSLILPDVCEYIYSTVSVKEVRGFSYFNFLNQVPCFIFGVLAYHACIGNKCKQAMFLAVVSCLFSFCVKLLAGGNFVVFVTSFAAFLMVFLNLRYIKFQHRFLCFLGTVTYSSYIVHWAVIAVFLSFTYLEGANFIMMFPVILLTTIILCVCLKPFAEDFPQLIAKKWIKKITKHTS